MSDQSLNIKDRHAWPVAGSILLIFLTAINAVIGFMVAAIGFASALTYYYWAKKKQRGRERNR